MEWKTVPTRLTQDMADAAKGVDGRLSVWKYDDAYKAMLANAPDAPSSPEVAQLQARVAELEDALAACKRHYRAFVLAVEEHASFESPSDDPSVGVCHPSAANRMIEGTWEYLGGRNA